MKRPPDLSHLARPGARLAVRVTPGAAAPGIAQTATGLSIRVTEPPADGRATEAARVLLAKALGVAKTRLTLDRGAQSRDKVFRLD